MSERRASGAWQVVNVLGDMMLEEVGEPSSTRCLVLSTFFYTTLMGTDPQGVQGGYSHKNVSRYVPLAAHFAHAGFQGARGERETTTSAMCTLGKCASAVPVAAVGLLNASDARWTSTKRIGCEILDSKVILIPIHLPGHWVLGCIRMNDHVLEYYDSLGGDGKDVLHNLAKWLEDEFKSKKRPQSLGNWGREAPKDIPKQTNGCDCGMFVVAYMKILLVHHRSGTLNTAAEARILNNLDFNFTQADIPEMRAVARAQIESYTSG